MRRLAAVLAALAVAVAVAAAFVWRSNLRYHGSARDMAPAERLLTLRLRRLVGVEPDAALALARQGDIQFPDGTDGADRRWVIVKSLTELNRFDEARTEARLMRERFPHHALTADVVRHMLDQPAGPP